MTKKELIEYAESIGLDVDANMTKKQISDMIDGVVQDGILNTESVEEPLVIDSRDILGVKPLSLSQQKNMTHTQIRAYNRLHGYK